MCKSDRKARNLTSAEAVDFVLAASAWREAYRIGWFGRIPNKRERRERDRIEQGKA